MPSLSVGRSGVYPTVSHGGSRCGSHRGDGLISRDVSVGVGDPVHASPSRHGENGGATWLGAVFDWTACLPTRMRAIGRSVSAVVDVGICWSARLSRTLGSGVWSIGTAPSWAPACRPPASVRRHAQGSRRRWAPKRPPQSAAVRRRKTRSAPGLLGHGVAHLESAEVFRLFSGQGRSGSALIGNSRIRLPSPFTACPGGQG
jgi:hypothetical protein